MHQDTFAMSGKSQPTKEKSDHSFIILADQTKRTLDRFIKGLNLEPFGAQPYTLHAPDGTRLSATFLKWHGNHCLMYVAKDDTTLAIHILDLMAYVRVPGFRPLNLREELSFSVHPDVLMNRHEDDTRGMREPLNVRLRAELLTLGDDNPRK